MKERENDGVSDKSKMINLQELNNTQKDKLKFQSPERDTLLQLIIDQLFYEGYQKVAAELILLTNLDLPCQASNRLGNLVLLGLAQEQNQNNLAVQLSAPLIDEELNLFKERDDSLRGETTADIILEKDVPVSTSTNNVGLQVDFDDPDIYYFAGGRHVGLQTDNLNDEFGPLELFPAGSSPVAVVMSTNETEIDPSLCQSPPKSKNKSENANLSKNSINKSVKRCLVRPIIANSHVVARPVKAQDIMKKREVGEDGWETVRSRSNRSKWSISSRSSSSSNNDLAVFSQSSVVPDSKLNQNLEDEAAAEDEKIQEKEAALDSAIREEELIEQELLQVEKDFHQIENQSTNSVAKQTKATETKNLAPSPDGFDVSDMEIDQCISDKSRTAETGQGDVEAEIDDCFFIDIAEDSHTKAEDFLAKETDRIVALREKLMSPAKRCDSAETLRRHQAKLAKAERNRERLLEAKYNRYVELSERFQTLNETTKRLVEERTELITRAEERRKRAVEKRQQLIQDIKKKAHDEESKAKEIAFINLLETQIKRNGFLSSAHAKELEVGERLQSRQEERKTKLEERFMKLSAVLERQSNIKHDWEAKLAQMQEKRKRTQERILREKQKRDKERTELAQEKARDREERLLALNAAKQAKKEELKKSIQQKQQDTARRHEENIEHIRQKAIELSVPRTSEDSSIRMCTLCKVVIQSEVQELAHLRSRAHLDAVKKMEKGSKPLHQSTVSTHFGTETFGLKFITDVHLDKVGAGITTDKSRVKLLKKHCNKLAQKLTITGKEFEATETPPQLSGKQWNDQTMNKNKIQKNIKEMDRLINLFNSQRGSLPLATSLDRLLSETRKAAVQSRFIQDSLIGMGLFPALRKIFDYKASDLPQRVFTGACNLVVGATFRNLYNALYVIRSSIICNILELASRRWENLIPDDHRWLCGSPVGHNEPLPVDPLIDTLIELLSNILGVVPDPFDGVSSANQTFLKEADIKSIHARTMDIIGYIVGSGIVDRLSVYCSGVRGPVEGQQNVANLLKESIDFLTVLIYSLQASWDQKKPDSTQLLAALESSEIAGAVSMSYSLLLHQGAPTRPRLIPNDTTKPLPPTPPGLLSGSLVRSTLCLINAFAKLDLNSLQRVLGSEAVSLQFRHITSQLLWQVVPYTEKDQNWARLVYELLMAIGNFTVKNIHNQGTIQSGQTPTVLQQLCGLPQIYFDDPRFTRFLFPTLIAATFGCPENEEILTQQNIPMELLHGFMNTEFARNNSICKRLIPNSTASNSQQ